MTSHGPPKATPVEGDSLWDTVNATNGLSSEGIPENFWVDDNHWTDDREKSVEYIYVTYEDRYGPRTKMEHLPCYWVMGMIGVGKTTLLTDASRHECAVFKEYVNGAFLDAYIQQPRRLAYAFQLSMMQSSLTRTHDARATLESSRVNGCRPTTVVIERPAQENVIFAVTNCETGNMTRDDLAEYFNFVRPMALELNNRLPAEVHQTHAVMPWTPESTTMERMISRGRLSEDVYSDAYMSRLAHNYFRWYIELLVLEGLVLHFETGELLEYTSHETTGQKMKKNIWGALHIPYLIEWTAYGKWIDVVNHLNDARAVEQQKTTRVFVCDDAEYNRRFADKKVHALHESEDKSEEPGILHLDMAWYFKNVGINTSFKYTSAMRDMFFQARIKQTTIVMHFEKHSIESLFNKTIFYECHFVEVNK